jgi:hypothetical protein
MPGKFFKIKFFSLPGEVFLIKKKKKVFMKNLRGASNIGKTFILKTFYYVMLSHHITN